MPMPRSDLRRRIRYRFDNFMARGGRSIFALMLIGFLAALGLLMVLRAIVALFVPPESGGGWGWNAFLTFLQMTEPGAMAEEAGAGWWHRGLAVVSGVTGLVLVATLIAFVTTGLDRRLHDLRKGRSRVEEEGHTLLLGWEDQRVVEIVRELVVANESVDRRAVVILAEEGKEHMDDYLAMMVPDTRTTVLVTRSGSPSSIHNLDLTAADAAAAAIVLASCPEVALESEKGESDARVVKTLLALRSRSRNGHPLPVVAEVFDPSIRSLISELGSGAMMTLDSHDILSRVLVQTSRSPGLSVVYDELLSFEGNEIYFTEADSAGITFGDVAFHYPQAVPMGIETPDGTIAMNPDPGTVLGASDRLLVLAEDDSTISFHREPVIRPDRRRPAGGRLPPSPERYLIVGHTPALPMVLAELSRYLLAGSTVDIMPCRGQKMDEACLQQLGETVSGIEVRCIALNPLDPDTWQHVAPASYQSIILLSDCDQAKKPDQTDSEAILVLLLIRRAMGGGASSKTTIVTELVDSANQPLATSAGVYDFVISSRLVSMLLAQVAEQPGMHRVFADLFDEEGSEIYLKPASLYVEDLPSELAFADLMIAAQARKEVCLGVRIAADEGRADRNFGVWLAPPKVERLTLTPDDRVVVLAEDDT
jgi:hypothetical protein